MKSKMQQTTELGAEFWNDSCAPAELKEAVENGATGATSNPVIVSGVVKADPATWNPLIDSIARDHRHATEDEIAWKLIDEIGIRAAKILQPVWEKSGGKKGYLSMQVSPKFHRDPERMLEHGKQLAALAPNIAIKAPTTEPGLIAMEGLVAAGINVNATVSFTVPQCVAVGEAFERGMDRAAKNGADMSRLHPWVTLMVGRLDDHLARVMTKEKISVDPGYLHWAGIAAFKKSHQIFVEKGYRSRMLAAAYRHHMHWSELVGDGVVLTIPHNWWTQFNKSDITPTRRLNEPVDPRIVDSLTRLFPDFRRAYEPDGMKPAEFASYGATVHTLQQFLGGYQELLGLVRERVVNF